METMEDMLHERVLWWAGHVARESNESLPRKLLFAWHGGGARTSRYGQTKYKYRLMETLRDRNILPAMWLQIAQSRTAWRKIVKGAKYEGVFKPNHKAVSKPPRLMVIKRPAANASAAIIRKRTCHCAQQYCSRSPGQSGRSSGESHT